MKFSVNIKRSPVSISRIAPVITTTTQAYSNKYRNRIRMMLGFIALKTPRQIRILKSIST
ncbi:Uncharacterised protein [Vibrio cholerae]|nr:Uncharacterised protein [Vibrio cholerae]